MSCADGACTCPRATDEFDKWFNTLSTQDQAAVVTAIDMLDVQGVSFNGKKTKPLKNSPLPGLRELKIGSTTIRVFYVFDANRDPVLLLGANKAGVSGGNKEEAWYKDQKQNANELYAEYELEMEGRRQSGVEVKADRADDLDEDYVRETLARSGTGSNVRRSPYRAAPDLSEVAVAATRRETAKPSMGPSL